MGKVWLDHRLHRIEGNFLYSKIARIMSPRVEEVLDQLVSQKASRISESIKGLIKEALDG